MNRRIYGYERISTAKQNIAKEKSERFRPDFFAVENQKAAISPNPVQRCSPKITQTHLNSDRKTEG